MSLIYLNELIKELESGKQFPPAREVKYRQRLHLYAAIRESEADILAPAWWWEDNDGETRRDFVVDPLGERIPEVWAEMLWGEEAEFTAPVKKDQDKLEELVDNNKLPEELPHAEQLRSSEGEVWWRLRTNPDKECCEIEFHSRLNVVPLVAGKDTKAAAIFSLIRPTGPEHDGTESEWWVYIEYHCEGWVLNRLYRWKKGRALGKPQPLSNQPETADLSPEWQHGLPMLCGVVKNKRARDNRIGKSDYQGVAGLLLFLSEVANIGQENVRLTAKQRVVVPERFLTARGQLPRGAEVIISTETDRDPDKVKDEWSQIEWEFDAKALVEYKSDLVDTILTRCRIAPELAGRRGDVTQTGPAERGKLIDTMMAGQGKGKGWDDQLPEVLSLAAQVESLSTSQGGLGTKWAQPENEPEVKRPSPLPEDEKSRSDRTVQEVNAKVLSRRTAIQVNHPEWSTARVDEEMEQLQKEADEAAKRAQEMGVPKTNSTGDPPRTQTSDGRPHNDPARSTIRNPGQPRPSSVPDPAKR